MRILILVSMYRYTSCALSDWLTCRPEGCSQPRELWFSDILISLLFMSTVLVFFPSIDGEGLPPYSSDRRRRDGLSKVHILFVLSTKSPTHHM